MNYWLTTLGSLLAGGGIAWAAYTATVGVNLNDFVHDAFSRIFSQTGPLEVCAVGILMWLMGKWRKHTLVR